MKNKILIALFLSLLFSTIEVSVTSAKGENSISTPCVKKIIKIDDPDREKAKAINLNTKNVFSILAKDYFHIEWAKFTIPKDGLVTLNLERYSNEEVWVRIESEDGKTIFLDEDTTRISQTMKNGSTNFTVGLRAGTYYLVLNNTAKVKFDRDLYYSVKYDQRNDYEKEENDTLDKANPISVNQTYSGDCSSSDTDYFLFENDKAGLTISLTQNYVNSQPYVELYDEKGRLINAKDKPESNGIMSKYYFDNLIQGKFYVKVGNRNNTTSYSLKLDTYTSGWISENGNKYFYNQGQKIIGLNQIGNKFYLFDESGAMQTGWKSVSGNWKYFDLDGTMKRGWLSYNGSWYFLDMKGNIVTDLIGIDNNIYYFDNNGVMLTGWVKRGTWRYFDSSGIMHRGWLKQNGTWYYMDDSGDMVTGFNFIDSTWYYFNSDGTYNCKLY